MGESAPNESLKSTRSASSYGQGSSSIKPFRDESILDTQIPRYPTPDPTSIPETIQPEDSINESPTTSPLPSPTKKFTPTVESGFGAKTKIPSTNKDGKKYLEPNCPSNKVLDEFLATELELGREIGSFSQFLLALSYMGNCENAGESQQGLDLPVDEHLRSISRCLEVRSKTQHYCQKVSAEADRYTTFCDLANTILTGINGEDGDKIFFMRSDPHNFASSDYTPGRRPDLAFIDRETKHKLGNDLEKNKGILKWTNTLGISEMKLSHKTIHYIDCTEKVEQDKAEDQGNSGSQTGSKRGSVSDNTDSNSNKRMKTENGVKKVGPGLRSSKELMKFLQQSARYACDHMTSDPLRDHVFHLLIRDGELWLAYYDHDGLLFSPPLDFVNDLYHFTYLLKVLSDFGRSEHGYCGTSEPIGIGGKMTALRFTTDTGEDEEFVVMEEGCNIVNRSLSGSHTQTRRVLTKEDKNGKIVPLRSSEVNSVQDSITSERILKWSRPLANRISEPDMIRIARRVLRKADKSRKLERFLPKVLYTKDIDRRIMRFRAMLGLEYEEKRILRFIIIEKLDPLYTIDDLRDFKSVVIDIFLGIHHLAISKERIKHRDITISSLMFRRTPDDKVQGVLSDWDLACNKKTEGEYNRDGMYVGTRAFISKDLHIRKSLIHYERYDYESLLYSLYWINVFYSQGKSRPETEISEAYTQWKKWNSYDDMIIYHAKESFVLSGWNEGYISSFFLPLSRSWLRSMRKLFHRGYSAKTFYEDEENPPLGNEKGKESMHCLSRTKFNEETLGGHVTFERIYKILLQ